MKQNPVIIIGAARSGTKFLRDMISNDAAYKCVPYDINYIWRMFEPNRVDDVLDTSKLDDGNKHKLAKTLYRLAELQMTDQVILVEKTVSNCLRIPFVDAVLPDAHFIHLIRDGRGVVESSLRMWETPPNKQNLLRKLRNLPLSQYNYLFWFGVNYIKGLNEGRSGGEVWGPRYPGILDDLKTCDLIEIVALQWKHCVEFAFRDLEKIPSSRYIEIRYEALADGDSEVKRLCEFLHLSDPEKFALDLKNGFARNNVEKWRSHLDERQLDLIHKNAGTCLNNLGYSDL